VDPPHPRPTDFRSALTAVHMSLRGVGAEAARSLLHGIESAELEAATVTLPVSLIVSGGTALATG
jgi:LacI family transcriptional regulator